MISRTIFAATCVLACVAAAPAARAEWPDHPVHWVVPFGPGGANDLIARVAADAVSKRLGQTIVIDNRPGRRCHCWHRRRRAGDSPMAIPS